MCKKQQSHVRVEFQFIYFALVRKKILRSSRREKKRNRGNMKSIFKKRISGG